MSVALEAIAVLLVLSLAIGQVVHLWYQSSLLRPLRMRAEVWVESFGERLAELLHCPYCLSHHVAWVLLVLLVAFGWIPVVRWIPWGLVTALAAVRLSWIINRMLPPDLRYDAPTRLEDEAIEPGAAADSTERPGGTGELAE